MEEKRLKVNIELHAVGDGRTFLNFWNSLNGDDVVVEVVDGKLILTNEDDIETEITIQEFIDKVKSKF